MPITYLNFIANFSRLFLVLPVVDHESTVDASTEQNVPVVAVQLGGSSAGSTQCASGFRLDLSLYHQIFPFVALKTILKNTR